MSSLSSEEFEKARRILWRYYDTIMEQATQDIIEHADEFEKGMFGNADEIIEKHHCRIARLSGIFSHLRGYTSDEKPKGTKPLGIDEFRCFSCGNVIKRNDKDAHFVNGHGNEFQDRTNSKLQKLRKS